MKAYGITDKGKVRKENQDCFLIETNIKNDFAVVVLCDGMGGAKAGSTASSMAAEAFMSHARDYFTSSSEERDINEMAADAANQANKKVYDRSISDFSCIGMGTTLVAAVVKNNRTVIVNIGDSRAYLLSGEKTKQITRDHSLVWELLRSGSITEEEAKNHPRKNIITRAVGVDSTVLCDVFAVDLNKSDIILLCSDGLSNIVGNEELLLAFKGKTSLEKGCGKLMDTALSRGASDNVTVAAIRR
ncbi:MAG: Stp1/IreP family PP2C-type Ser/Thr phosphatase [Oscillospiraceae bacterium]|nr:Stp1/IreP family PP2C-type Ser/Thr phosphatase [Oscillospiraceae bacterium]